MTEYILYLSKVKKISPLTIQTRLSSLKSLLFMSVGMDYVSHPVVTDMIKGLKRIHYENNPRGAIVPEWQLAYVLDSLRHAPYEPAHLATLEHWSKKTLFLLALASGRRVSEIHALSFERCQFEILNDNKEVRLRPDVHFRSKTQPVAEMATDIIIPALTRIVTDQIERALCPVRALLYYKEKTKDVRRGQTNMFVCHAKGKNSTAANARTLARWFKEVVYLAYHKYTGTSEGKNSMKVHIHQARSLASSILFAKGASMAQVMQAAYWKSHNTFTSYYLMNLTSQMDGLSKMGKIVTAQKVV